MEPIESLLARKPISDAVKERLVEQFEPFCHAMARDVQKVPLSRSYGDNDDWLQEARMALISAGERFDPKRRVKFLTYATAHVFGKLRAKARANNGLIRVPTYCLLDPDMKLLVDKLRAASLVYVDGSGEAIGVPCQDDSRDDGIDLDKAIKCLLSSELKVIVKRFGLDGEKKKKLQDIGDEVGLSKERIRQIEKKAIVKLKAAMSR